jgi:hypothetical protein
MSEADEILPRAGPSLRRRAGVAEGRVLIRN